MHSNQVKSNMESFWSMYEITEFRCYWDRWVHIDRKTARHTDDKWIDGSNQSALDYMYTYGILDERGVFLIV